MNKKILFSLVFIISLSCIWAVWEGNGGIGSSTDFPAEGLFVRSDMFPKHTLLEITNLEKNIKARAVVIGSSGIPGLLVSLSPELGKKLAVPNGKVIRMRVLTPSPVQEVGDDGISIIGTGPESQDFDSNPALLVASESDLSSTDIKAEKEAGAPVSENLSSETILYDKLPEPALEEPPLSVEEVSEPPESETIADVPNIEVISQPEEEPEPPMEEATVEEPLTDETVPTVSKVEEAVTNETYMEPANEKPPITVDPINEPVQEQEIPPKPVDEVSRPQAPTEIGEEIAPVETISPIIEPADESQPEEKKPEIIAEIAPKSESVSIAEESPKAVENIPDSSESTSYDESTESDNIYKIDNDEKVEEKYIMPIVEETKAVSSKLEKDKTYVQIVIYNDKYNRDEVLKKYGKNYPMVVEESFVKNGTRYTIFVGPLKPQETGAVLERFKQLGFKDAFLKKGK